MNTHQLHHTMIPSKHHQNRFILSFSPKTSFVSKIFRTFANAICPLWFWGPNRREEPLGGALHIERRYWRFVFGLSKLPQSNNGQEQCWVLPRGCILDSVVCCEDTCILISTLYGVLYTPALVFTLFVYRYGCGRPRKSNRQKLSTPFFVCREPYKC